MNARFAYTGIRVRDMDRAIRFYTEGLGMQLRDRRKIPRTGGENVDLAFPGSDHVLELNWYPRKGMVKEYRKGDELDHMAFGVESVKQAVEHLARHGARVTVEPFYELGSWVAFLSDPDGIWIELLSKDP
jgi:lactoylglutathione lyase